MARDLVDVFAEHLGLPRAFVRQIIAALKVAERIASARRAAPIRTLSDAELMRLLAESPFPVLNMAWV